MNPNNGSDFSRKFEGNPILDPNSLEPLQILHLEDSDLDAAIFRAASLRCSRELVVKRVASILEFTEALGSSEPHLICADHLLPDGSALDAIEVALERFPDVPFMVITGAGEEELAVDYIKSGAAHYLSKRKLDLFPEVLDTVLETFRTKTLHAWSEVERQRLTEDLLALTRKVAEDSDEEKRSLSRDIHDQLGQELTALKLGLFWIDHQIRKPSSKISSADILEKLEQLISINTSIIGEVRNIAHALRPVVLDQVGLSAGLETLVQDFNRRENAFCGLNLDILPNLSENLRTDIFRIVQEALTNISRHAQANLAYISLKVHPEKIVLEIGDDGIGLPQSPLGKTTRGLGMVGMRERARNHGAYFNVTSKSQMGTSIVIEFNNSPSL